MAKNINGTTTQFLYDGLNPVQELDGASPPSVMANLLTGLDIDEHFTRTDVNGPMSFLTDALGSTVALTDSTGDVNTSYSYDPFGNTSINGSSGNSYQYTGRENDGTGMYYYRARYYSPTFQRFITQDPMDFSAGDADLYAYVRDTPTDLADPTGQQAEMICEEVPQLCDEAGEGLSALINALGAAAAGAEHLLCRNDRKKKCEDQYYNVDIPTCNGVSRTRGKAAGQRCFASAMQRFAACLRGEPLPPLDVWNN